MKRHREQQANGVALFPAIMPSLQPWAEKLAVALPDVVKGSQSPMTVITSIEDLRVLAQKRVPRMFYDYADSGSWTESTYRANEADFQPIKLRQRVAVDIEQRSTATTMVGVDVTMPVAIAPIGLDRHAARRRRDPRRARGREVRHPVHALDDEHLLDRGRRRGTPTKPFWFQLYVMRDRDFIERLIDRAKAAQLRRAGADARPADPRPAPQGPEERPVGRRPSRRSRTSSTSTTKPRWCLGMLGTKRRQFGNIVGHVKGVERHGLARRTGPRSSSTRASTGTTSSGSRSAGAAS